MLDRQCRNTVVDYATPSACAGVADQRLVTNTVRSGMSWMVSLEEIEGFECK
jgi:hypothetical protein